MALLSTYHSCHSHHTALYLPHVSHLLYQYDLRNVQTLYKEVMAISESLKRKLPPHNLGGQVNFTRE